VHKNQGSHVALDRAEPHGGDLEVRCGGTLTRPKGPRAWVAAGGRGLKRGWQAVTEYLKEPVNRRTCALAAAAGAASGVMEGMTGGWVMVMVQAMVQALSTQQPVWILSKHSG
jgi:hypothetical protein